MGDIHKKEFSFLEMGSNRSFTIQSGSESFHFINNSSILEASISPGLFFDETNIPHYTNSFYI